MTEKMAPTLSRDDIILAVPSSVSLSWNWTDVTKVSHGITDTTINPMNFTSNTSSVPDSSPVCLVLQFQLDFLPWDNPDNLVSAQTEDFVRRLRDVVILPILFLIGGPANLINMAVFYKQGLKERINVCLFALSIADELYLLFNMILYGEQLHLQFTSKEK